MTGAGEGNEEEVAGLPTYVTGPRGSKRAILLLSDAIGFEAPKFRRLADKIAEGGFLVVAPDFFYGDALDIHNAIANRDAWMKAHDGDKGCENAKAVVAALKSKGVSVIGAAGFCWGGMVVAKLARFDDCIQCAVILHPSPITVEEIHEIKVPTALLGAEIDDQCPPEYLQYLGEVLSAKTEIDSFMKIYPGVKHGWTLMYKDDEAAVKIAQESHSDMFNWITKYI